MKMLERLTKFVVIPCSVLAFIIAIIMIIIIFSYYKTWVTVYSEYD